MISGALFPGNTLSPTQARADVAQCARCMWTYCSHLERRVKTKEWCDQCQDILFDREEDEIWGKRKANPFIMFGWMFEVIVTISPYHTEKECYLRLHKKLINPEAPHLDYSFSSFRFTGEDEREFLLKREHACMWLIAHWWEHALDICPCQHGVRNDIEGSSFRKHLIESLNYWNKAGLS